MSTEVLIPVSKDTVKKYLKNYYVDGENMYDVLKQELKSDIFLLVWFVTTGVCLVSLNELGIPIQISLGKNKIIELRKQNKMRKNVSFIKTQKGRPYSNLHYSLLESQVSS